MRTESNETVAVISSLIVTPSLVYQSALLSESFLPSWMQTVSNFNPVSYADNDGRPLMVTGFDWTANAKGYAVLGLSLFMTWTA